MIYWLGKRNWLPTGDGKTPSGFDTENLSGIWTKCTNNDLPSNGHAIEYQILTKYGK
jgi:hypothetical protein